MDRARLGRALPFLILLGAFTLRLFRLGLESLWYDETVSLLLARSDLAELTRHTAGDIHPPLYYYLLHFWGPFAGWSEFAAAFLSLWFGVLLVALVYRVAREWVGARVATIAAFLVALSPFNVWYSQEVRMYTLGAVLGLASVYFLLQLLADPRPSSRHFWAYVVVTALGIYTLYYFAFLILFEYMLVLVSLSLPYMSGTGAKFFETAIPLGFANGAWATRDQVSPPAKERNRNELTQTPYAPRRRIGVFLLSQFVIGILYLPWLPTAIRQAIDPPVPPWRSFTSLPSMLAESLSALLLGQSVETVIVAPLILITVLAVIWLFFRSRAIALFLGAYTFVPLLTIFVFSLWKPLYHVRYIFTYSPAFYILLAVALIFAAEQLARKRDQIQRAVAGGALGVLVLFSGYSLYNAWFNPQYADDDLRGAVQHLAENWRPGDAILVSAGYAYPALVYYFAGPVPQRLRLVSYQPVPDDARTGPVVLTSGLIGGDTRLGWGDPLSDFYATTAAETRAALERVFSTHPRVWVLRIYDTVGDANGVIRQYFSEHAQLIDDQSITGQSNARVQGYLTQKTDALPQDAAALGVKLDARVELVGFQDLQAPRRAGAYYDAVLYWRAIESLNQNYQLSLQVLDGNGQVVAQTDEMPLGSALPTSRWRKDEIYREPVRLRLPDSLSGGDYAVIVKLYRLDDGQVLGEPVRVAAFKLAL